MIFELPLLFYYRQFTVTGFMATESRTRRSACCSALQVGNTRAEAEQARAQVAEAERDAQAVRVELEREKEQIRRELQGRLSELEVLPEALRRCQLQLQEAQEEERSRERRNLELSGNLTELRLKVLLSDPTEPPGVCCCFSQCVSVRWTPRAAKRTCSGRRTSC